MNDNRVQLTDQQQAVVAHDDGPALVFAVAGAGKTTAMVHRIARLVEDGVFPAKQILATSFGRANVVDLREALRPSPTCRHVDIRTLHSLGRRVIQRAQQFGHETQWRLNMNTGVEQRILSQALGQARKANVPYKRELDSLDRRDFFDYVSYCKGNLLYPDFKRTDLPAAAKKVAGQAPPPAEPLGWYLDLYQLFEQVRRRRGDVTFDDMLFTGWEILVRYPDVLTAVQATYQSVLVDEFQDINLAQAEILDQITAPHRNYMAVGDDDQTIYEWRGADPKFILNFPQHYGATRYLISDNFRCPAAPLALANKVIAHNKKRERKRLNLTRGFFGRTEERTDKDTAVMSRRIVQTIQELAADGAPLNDVAVLVRLNAQTPIIEQTLIAEGIPYRVSRPFYERSEIKTLIHYGRVAWIERELQAGRPALRHETPREKFAEAWRDICNRPKRYISAALREQLSRRIIGAQTPPSRVVAQASAAAAQDWLAEPLSFLADDIAWLAQSLDKPAYNVLKELDARLAYQNFLRESSGFPQTGEGRAVSAAMFIEYAREQGSLVAFMTHIAELASQKTGQSGADEAVTLSTIHQAKGLEWPVVFLAQCNQEILPFQAVRTEDLEEERRLFYVAVTRTQRDLFLHVVKSEKRSQFLQEAQAKQVLRIVPQLGEILAREPQTWSAEDALLLIRHLPEFHLERYVTAWQPVPAAQKQAAALAIQRFMAAAAHHGLIEPLGLQSARVEWWRDLAALPEGERPSTFPGLDALREQIKTRQPARKSPSRRARRAKSKPAPEPDVIRAGMWVHSNVGWGRIEQILDVAERPLTEVERGNQFIRLHVTLRPTLDAEPVEIDVSATRILFLQAEKLYTCTRCGRFSAASPNVIVDKHNEAMHAGTGARYRQEKVRERTLTGLRYRADAPPHPLRE